MGYGVQALSVRRAGLARALCGLCLYQKGHSGQVETHTSLSSEAHAALNHNQAHSELRIGL